MIDPSNWPMVTGTIFKPGLYWSLNTKGNWCLVDLDKGTTTRDCLYGPVEISKCIDKSIPDAPTIKVFFIENKSSKRRQWCVSKGLAWLPVNAIDSQGSDVFLTLKDLCNVIKCVELTPEASQ